MTARERMHQYGLTLRTGEIEQDRDRIENALIVHAEAVREEAAKVAEHEFDGYRGRYYIASEKIAASIRAIEVK